MGRVSHVRALTPNFTAVALKRWAYAEIADFWYTEFGPDRLRYAGIIPKD